MRIKIIDDKYPDLFNKEFDVEWTIDYVNSLGENKTFYHIKNSDPLVINYFGESQIEIISKH